MKLLTMVIFRNSLIVAISVFSLFFWSCGNEKHVYGWDKNELISWKGDTLNAVFYTDTIQAVGPLKYGCFHFNTGSEWFGESVLMGANETIPELVNRLKNARKEHYMSCIECGDASYLIGSEQNLDIIQIYYHLKLNQTDSALKILERRSPEWQYWSRHSDLYLEALLQQFDKNAILSSVEQIPELDQQDSIKLVNQWLHWGPINSYNYKLYQDNINWKHYFETTLERLSRQGL